MCDVTFKSLMSATNLSKLLSAPTVILRPGAIDGRPLCRIDSRKFSIQARKCFLDPADQPHRVVLRHPLLEVISEYFSRHISEARIVAARRSTASEGMRFAIQYQLLGRRLMNRKFVGDYRESVPLVVTIAESPCSG
jgi:hypothetical protein